MFSMHHPQLPKETLTVAEAAKLCGVTRVTMWRWVKANDLPATTTVGGHHRIRKSDLVAYLGRKSRATGDDDGQRRILIVDDDPHIRKLMRRSLERARYRVETCSNGFEAGICVIRFKPRLMILDLFMPFMDGFQVCRSLKGDPETSAIRIIAISGHATSARIEKVLQCGADMFMKKPLPMGLVIKQIDSLLRQPIVV